jgi:L-serine/L-threonine ammonia-lyase
MSASSSVAKQLFIKTPLIKHAVVGGVEVYYKMELFQPSGSFKDRGISHMIKTLSEREPVSKFVCSSGGNAGHAVAVACEAFAVPCDVYVPTTTLPMMIEKLKLRGANVVVSGENWNAADLLARQALANDSSARYIPPYDDPLLWEGHSTLVDELVAELGADCKPDAVVLSVGGGGLLVGVQQGLARNGWLDVAVLAVETEGAASYAAAKKAGEVGNNSTNKYFLRPAFWVLEGS